MPMMPRKNENTSGVVEVNLVPALLTTKTETKGCRREEVISEGAQSRRASGNVFQKAQEERSCPGFFCLICIGIVFFCQVTLCLRT